MDNPPVRIQGPNGEWITPLTTEEQGQPGRWDKDAWLKRIYPPDGVRPPPTPEKGKRKRSDAEFKVSYTLDAQRARESGLVPLSDAHRAELRRKLEQLNVGVYCVFVYLTDKSHLTRKGEFVSFDEKEITLLGDTGQFWRVPIDRVFHGTYNVEQQGGKLK